ncbi:hypothetical protein ACFV6G_29490 [Streptomyces lavendulae]|uniref:hypothetical protein n=1 Tax=Streptomyces lavendulae TaxID=1914 RepID=UPI00367ABE40
MSHTDDHTPSRVPGKIDERPFFELRVGGLHLTMQRPPYRLMTLTATALTTGVATWITQR